MSKETNKETYSGIVVPKDGLFIGTKKQKHYAKGVVFKTDNKALFENLLKNKKIK